MEQTESYKILYRLPNTLEVVYLKAEETLEQDFDFFFCPFYQNKAIKLKARKQISAFTAKQLNMFYFHPNQLELPSETQDDDFKGQVSEAISAIKQNHYRKVVLSRVVRKSLENTPDWHAYFDKLCKMHPAAFICAFSSVKYGNWICASPELLLNSVGRHAKTVSLAGTMPHLTNDTWTPKEIEEQTLVTEYLNNELKTRGYQVSIHPPKQIQAGKVMHLLSEVEIFSNENINGLGLAQVLHPTPAVSGFPKADSIQFIKKNELHNRDLYAGFWGVNNSETDFNAYVNLRCMQISGNDIALYAGAGITRDSIPADELAETDLKVSTLLEPLVH